MRRCIACRESKPQGELVRFTVKGGEIAADTGAKADGRGYYICKDGECLENALKRKAFNRICKRNVDVEKVRNIIEQALDYQGGIDVKES